VFIPRKSFEVCRIVPSIKLVNAQAMCKIVIVPDLLILLDEIGAHPAGWYSRLANSVNLVAAIKRALSDPADL